MGYDSSFSGSMTPSKKIPDWLVERLNAADLSVMVQGERDEVCDGDVGDIVPSSYEMHGYDIALELLMVQRALAKEGIKLTGDIYRRGLDGGDDFEKITAKGGKIYTTAGEVVYRNRVEVRPEQLLQYAVKIVRETPGKEDEFAGWLGARIYFSSKDRWLKTDPVDISEAPRFVTMDDAAEAIRENKEDGIRYEVLEVEREI